MDSICLGAFATLEEAEQAKAIRQEPQEQLAVIEDGEAEHPFRVWWNRQSN